MDTNTPERSLLERNQSLVRSALEVQGSRKSEISKSPFFLQLLCGLQSPSKAFPYNVSMNSFMAAEFCVILQKFFSSKIILYSKNYLNVWLLCSIPTIMCPSFYLFGEAAEKQAPNMETQQRVRKRISAVLSL